MSLMMPDDFANVLYEYALKQNAVPADAKREFFGEVRTDKQFLGAFQAIEQAVIERCAVVCDEETANAHEAFNDNGCSYNLGASEQGEACAAAIRAMTKGE